MSLFDRHENFQKSKCLIVCFIYIYIVLYIIYIYYIYNRTIYIYIYSPILCKNDLLKMARHFLGSG